MALADAAALRGAEVTVIAANVMLPAPPGVNVIAVSSADELARRCAEGFEHCDVLLMAAAVADFRPAASRRAQAEEGPGRTGHRPGAHGGRARRPRRAPAPGQVIVGFAAEHGGGALSYAADKLERKRLDAIVVNDISQPGIGFETEENEVTILTRDGHARPVPREAKSLVASAILDEVIRLIDLTPDDEGIVGSLRDDVTVG